MKKYNETVIPFEADDGHHINLIHVEGEKPPPNGPVLLVHGAGVRANIFRAPVQKSIVDVLIENGFDVWLENWRASIDLQPTQWNLDLAAAYDHPAAVRKVVELTGIDEIKAIIHCQGSTSFMMSAVAGLVPQVKTILSNAVSLHPVVPKLSNTKLRFVLPVFKMLSDHLNPQWGKHAPTFPAKLVSSLVELTHRECDNGVCKQVSFSYGSGFPALWSHENLNDETHEWLKDEFAFVPMRFYQQIGKCVRTGHLVSMQPSTMLPADFTAQAPKTDARFAFFAGRDNLCFLPESQELSFDFFNGFQKDYHSLHLLAGYGHLDVFMGKDASRDVFPVMIEELKK